MRLVDVALPRRWYLVIVVLLLFAAACERKPAEPGRVTGRVLRRGVGVPGAMVQVFSKADQDRATPPVAEAPSDADGTFSVDVPPGRYWVWAKATVTEGSRDARLVGQATPNPVEPRAGREVVVKIELADPSGFSDSSGPEGAGVTGMVTVPKDNKTSTIVYVYPGEVLKPIGPGFLAAVEVKADGKFRVNIVPGSYTLAVRQRKSGRDYGSPESSDLVAVRHASVTKDSYVDVGDLLPAPLDPEAWKKVTATMGSSPTSVGGRILDAGDKPVEGIRVLAFRDGRMTGKPAFVSPPSGKDGSYLLPLSPAGGRYFLGARSRLGGPSAPGEKVGQERGASGAGIPVKPDEKMTGVDIHVEEVW